MRTWSRRIGHALAITAVLGILGGLPAGADPAADVSVSVHGVTRVQLGDSSATSTEQGIAVAVRDSTATARGEGSLAVAVGGSTASARGRSSLAVAVGGSTAAARGCDSSAKAVLDSSATASGKDSSAMAVNGGTAVDVGGSCDGDGHDG